MAKLTTKVQHAVEEGRILVIGATLLTGFSYRSVFEKGFEQLPKATQYAKLGGLGLLLSTLLFLMWPSAFHQLAADGDDTHEVHRFTSRCMDWALLPFALAIAIDVFMAVEKVHGRLAGVLAGTVAGAVALFMWYGWESIKKQRRRTTLGLVEIHGTWAEGAHPLEKQMNEQEQDRQQQGEKTPIKDKIDHVLEEVRSVLPGVQALLGFQLATMLVEGFDKLPSSSKDVHLLSLGFNALAVVLLMAPAAYHRIVTEGEDTEDTHAFAARMTLAAMVPLALGLAGDLFVVIRKVTESGPLAIASAALLLVLYYGAWFGYTTFKRASRGQDAKQPGGALAHAA